MARITVCDLCRQEIKDDETVQYVFPELVINNVVGSYAALGKQWWRTRYMELCEDCRMKVIHALKGVVNLERK